MAKDTLPAISEHGASGEIAELYADIRQTLNVSAINYVWRHIATIDGGLRWAWQAAKPMFVSGRVERECEHLQAQLSYPQLPRLSDTTLSLVGVHADGRDAIGAILDTYNRGNLLNMVSLSALLAEAVTPPAGQRPRDDLPATDLPLPPIPEVADLSDEISDQVLALNTLGAKPGPNRVVASIYKHIALWPGYLSVAWVQLAAMHEDGSLLQLIEDTQHKARCHAAYLAGDLGPRPDGPVADQVRRTVFEFTDTVIARMIPIGQMMRQSLNCA
ncbi:MAG: hypothetical protein WBN68_10375 [Sedimenticolaceae bacterium]